MTVQDVITILNDYAPLHYAEDFDNTGLLVGDATSKVSGVLVTLDTLEAVVDEAIENNCNLIVSFHPIIFSGLKNLTGKTYVERTVQKAIKNDISIFAIHTALDNSWNGVNAKICDVLGLQNRKILVPKSQTIQKLTTYVPSSNTELVRNALFETGAGTIGNYSHCSFTTEGQGSFKGEDGSTPKVGKIGELHFETESQLSVTFPKHLQANILRTLFNSHPYEEVAYEITTLENSHQQLGMGMIGEITEAVSEKEFLSTVKSKFKTGCVKHSALTNKTIKKVAVLGGSGSFAIKAAKAQGADAFVSADFKYHDFFQAENQILLCDVGHYESEQYTKDLLVAILTKKITNFAVVLSQTNTNPISYF
ncbi:Nif3-like dinuclear metal center hexameric protein [Rasiella sp. SM2506]|uniref:Nif3-like dinuclear metal center hexameric protein n=1 Tax=Rasiella sp. SM2506 TaxID=3423914 RepID=UPI003D79889C